MDDKIESIWTKQNQICKNRSQKQTKNKLKSNHKKEIIRNRKNCKCTNLSVININSTRNQTECLTNFEEKYRFAEDGLSLV